MRSLTNNFALAYAVEQSLGVLPGSPTWKLLEPNSIGKFGSNLATVARGPISKDRQRRKGVITDNDSGVDFEVDFTVDAFLDFAAGFMFSRFKGAEVYRPTSVTSTHYVVPVGTALPQNALVYVRGCTNAANNGLKVVGAGSTTTTIVTSGLAAESIAATANVTVEVCGIRAGTSDVTVDASGNLTSTALDFTTFGMGLTLLPGTFIWVGGDTAHAFATAANRGYARVRAVAANLLTLDKKATTWVADAGTGKTIDIYVGRFLRNVDVDHADYVESSFQFEGAYANLQNPGPGAEYEYSKGNYCNEMSFQLPLANKATVGLGFIGTDTPAPSTTRATNAASPLVPVQTSALSTSTDIARLGVQKYDETGLTTDFKSLTLTLKNNVSAEKVLGTLGAKYLNTGLFEVDLTCQVLFTDSDVVAAVRANEQVTMAFAVRNSDGAIVGDIPSMTLGGGNRDFPANETILASLTGQAYRDPSLGYSLGVTVFPYAPAA